MSAEDQIKAFFTVYKKAAPVRWIMSGVSALSGSDGGRGAVGKLIALLSSAAVIIRTWGEIDPTGDISMEFIAAIPTWAIILIMALALLGAFSFAYIRYTSKYITVKKHAVKAGEEVPKFGKEYKVAMALDTIIGGLFGIGIGVVADILIINFILSNYETTPIAIPVIFGAMLAYILGVLIAFVLDAYVVHDYFNGKADEKITAAEEAAKKAAEEQLASEENRKAALAKIAETTQSWGINLGDDAVAKIASLMETDNLTVIQAYTFLKENGVVA